MGQESIIAASVKGNTKADFWWKGLPDHQLFAEIPEGTTLLDLGRIAFGAADGSGDLWTYEKVASEYNGKAVPGNFMVKRSDQDAPFPNYQVGKVYATLNPSDLIDVCGYMTETGEVFGRTAFSLDGGRQIVALFETKNQFSVKRSDGTFAPTLDYIVASTGLGRQTALGETGVDVLCANTFTYAEDADGSNWFRMRHTPGSHARAQSDVQRFFGLHAERFVSHADIMQGLAYSPLTKNSAAALFAQVALGEPDPLKAREEVERRAKRARESKSGKDKGATQLANTVSELLHLYHEGDGLKGTDCYDALGAVTQWVDRGRSATTPRKGAAFELATPRGHSDIVSELLLGPIPREGAPERTALVGELLGDDPKASKRVMGAWFGDGAKTKRLAYDLLVQHAGGSVGATV